MKLEPVISEKTMNLAKEGKYTFRIDRGLNKYQIKNLVEKMFNVHVTRVLTVKESGENKKNMYGRKRTIHPAKKAVIYLKEKEKIDLFEESKK